jgi:hypothetical protein
MFIEDSKDIEMFLNSYEERYVTGIPYEKYISEAVKLWYGGHLL